MNKFLLGVLNVAMLIAVDEMKCCYVKIWLNAMLYPDTLYGRVSVTVPLLGHR